ncbi:hypothetical protein ABZS88_22445 [Streptomyces sp. NPDC005480]|uniref:hypothetical protein n=1 Tax=Streptomyces sp. NPDC005480 TaxID=3154880 RepID=UPI0033B72D1A
MSEPRHEDDGSHGPGKERGPRAGRGLPDELRALGRSLDGLGPGGESMAERVLAQILAESVPAPVAEPEAVPARGRLARRWIRKRWRMLTAGMCGVLTVLVLTPPVRAAVVDWFGFGGVEVRYDPSALPSSGAHVPGCGTSLSLGEARRGAGFEPLVPDELGMPDAVTVTREPKSRFLITLCWREDGRTIRLDEYPAQLDIGYMKSVRMQLRWVDLGPDTGLWFAQPHLLSFWMLDGNGDRWTRSERTAGPTLLWTRRQQVTLRLEGIDSQQRAMEIARSVRKPDAVR